MKQAKDNTILPGESNKSFPVVAGNIVFNDDIESAFNEAIMKSTAELASQANDKLNWKFLLTSHFQT